MKNKNYVKLQYIINEGNFEDDCLEIVFKDSDIPSEVMFDAPPSLLLAKAVKSKCMDLIEEINTYYKEAFGNAIIEKAGLKVSIFLEDQPEPYLHSYSYSNTVIDDSSPDRDVLKITSTGEMLFLLAMNTLAILSSVEDELLRTIKSIVNEEKAKAFTDEPKRENKPAIPIRAKKRKK